MNGINRLIAIFLILSLASCDLTSYMCVDDAQEKVINSDCGTIIIKAHSLYTDAIEFVFNGSFTVDIDALKLSYEDEDHNIESECIYFKSKTYDILKGEADIINSQGEERMRIDVRGMVPLHWGSNPMRLYLLPSDFITCNGNPVITDTISFQIIQKK